MVQRSMTCLLRPIHPREEVVGIPGIATIPAFQAFLGLVVLIIGACLPL